MSWFKHSPRAQNWVASIFVVAVFYVVSFGPACWLAMRLDPRRHQVHFHVLASIYEPVSRMIMASPAPLREATKVYLQLGAPASVGGIWVLDDAIVWERPDFTTTLISI